MADIIEKYGDSVIQHGSGNRRIYLMKAAKSDLPGLIPVLDNLCREQGYTKIFAKVPASCSLPFLSSGYILEGFIPDFFSGSEDAFFLGKFFSDSRTHRPEGSLEKFSGLLRSLPVRIPDEESDLSVCEMNREDCREMAKLYGSVFPSYPFPIMEAGYLAETMSENVQYFGIREKGAIIALSSAERDFDNRNVEMTDFAVLPEARGRKLAVHLLRRMEEEMKKQGFCTAYTIARLESMGMNKTFYKLGYKYSGTLINNTNISGSIESMNLWYKKLQQLPCNGIS